MRDAETETMALSDDLRVEEPAIDTDALTAAASALVDAQHGGAFVTSFDMTPRDTALALALTSTQLPQLQAECDPSDDVVHDWRRVRGKKGSRVRLWERGSASTLTRPNRHLRRRGTVVVSTNDKETFAVRSSITVHAPLASVLKTLDCSTATSYRSFTKIMYESLVTDTSVLSCARVDANATSPSHLAEALAVRWLVCKCTSPLVSDCDMSLVEYTKVHSLDDFVAAGDAPNNNHDEEERTKTTTRDGLRVREKLPAAFKAFRSLETRHCPVLSDAPHYLERVHIPLGGYLLYATDNDDITDVVFFMTATYERKKATTSTFLTSDDRQFRAIQHVLHRMALAIGRIPNAVDAYTMSLQLESLKLTRWIENSDRTECVVCFHRFHPLTRRRHHCRMCGDVICRDCSIHKDADLPTIGPTTLRICKLCDVQHFGRSSVLATIATDVKRMGTGQTHTALQQRELALETTTFDSPTVVRQRHRHRRLTEKSLEASKSSSSRSKGGNSAAVESPSTNRGRRHSLETPMSCPKPARKLAERWTNARTNQSPSPPTMASRASPSGAGKWSKAFSANRAAAASPLPQHPPRPMATTPTARSSPMHSPPARFAQTMPMPQASSPSSQTFNFGLMKSPHVPRPRHKSISELSLDSPADACKTTPIYFAAPPPTRHLTRGSSLYSKPSENQSSGSDRRSSQRDSSIVGHRARLDQIELYEDLLMDLCERASDAADATYAALSLFTSQNPAKSTSDGSALTMAHYLKVRGTPKLMKIAPNLQCCEPVLRAGESIVTRNALHFKRDGYDFATLPFVKGPQQARFYAGVPLVDSQERLVGALAVFDAQLVDEDDDVLQCPTLLESMARSTMARIETRRADKALETFMNAPLLRQSEPTVVSRRHAETVETKDDDVDEEERVRSLDVPRHRQRTTHTSYTTTFSPMNSSSKTNSLNYYKQQMHRLVQQANQTQDQVRQMHHVSY